MQSNRMLVMEANQEPRNEVFATSPSLIDYQADKPGLDKKDIDQWSDGGVVDGRVVCFPDRSHNILIWEDNQDCNETFAGIDIPSDVAVKNTPQFQNFAVLNGKFYAAPHSAEHILIYDEVNGAIKSSSEKVPNDYKTGDDDQWSGTVAISGKVYGVPSSSKFVLIYNPSTDAITASPAISDDIHGGKSSWSNGAVLDGKMHGIPFNANYILIYDPLTNQLSASGQVPEDVDGGDHQWYGGASLYGNVYGCPFDADHVLVYNGKTGKITGSDKLSNDVDGGDGQWRGGVAHHGVLVCIPSNANVVLVYSPVTGKVTSSKKIRGVVDTGDSMWNGGVSLGGKVYGMPDKADHLLIYDHYINHVYGSTKLPGDFASDGSKWVGAAVMDGYLFATPNEHGQVLKYKAVGVACDEKTTTTTTKITTTVTTTTVTTTTDKDRYCDVRVDGTKIQLETDAYCCKGERSWMGGTVVDHNVYGIPYGANYFVIFNVLTEETSQSPPVPIQFADGAKKWWGGVAVGDTVVAIPHGSAHVVWYDTAANIVNGTAAIGVDDEGVAIGAAGTRQWAGGVAIGGKVFGAPYDARRVLIFDTATAKITASELIPTSIDFDDAMWTGGVALNGVAYFIPCTAKHVLIYQPADDTLRWSSEIPFKIRPLDVAGNMWLGGALINSTIYGIPADSRQMLIYNPLEGEEFVQSNADVGFHLLTGSRFMDGGVYDNKVFGIPDAADAVLIYDAVEDTVTHSPTPSVTIRTKESLTNRWKGGVVFHGKAIGMPHQAEYVLNFSPERTECTTTTTTTATTTTTTTLTTTTVTATTITTTTTQTYFRAGEVCTIDDNCLNAKLCRQHCCNNGVPRDCPSCGSNGECYKRLALNPKWHWDPTSSDANDASRWAKLFDKGEKYQLEPPPALVRNATDGAVLLNAKGGSSQLRFKLFWADYNATTNNDGSFATNVFGNNTNSIYDYTALGANVSLSLMQRANEGVDPGLFDVDATTGVISCEPRRNGLFSMFLVLEDEAGFAPEVNLPAEYNQVIVKHWSFEVKGKPDFVVNGYRRVAVDDLPRLPEGELPYMGYPSKSPGAAGQTPNKNRITPVSVTVGSYYRFAPFVTEDVVDTVAYSYASGGSQASIKFSIRNAPPGFFIDTKTGAVQGQPRLQAEDTYTTDLLAIDPSGAEAFIEKIRFTVLPQPIFDYHSTTTNRRKTQIDGDFSFTDPTDPRSEFLVGRSYTIARLETDEAKTTVSKGTVGDIGFSLSPDAPSTLYVQAQTGTIFGSFDEPGRYTFDLLAFDLAGETCVAESFDFDVVELGEFTVDSFGRVPSTIRNFGDSVYTDPNDKDRIYAVGETYQFAAVQINSVSGTKSNTTGLRFALKNAPVGFLLDSSDGFIQGTPIAEGEFSMSLQAIDGDNRNALVEEISLQIKHRDCDVPGNGPSGEACANGNCVDDTLFDGRFTCNCKGTKYDGDNCKFEPEEEVVAAAADPLENVGGAVGGVLGGAIGLILFVLIVQRYNSYRLKVKVFDFKAEIAKLLDTGEIDAAHGASGTMKSVLPREIKRRHVNMTKKIGEGAFGEVCN